MAWECLGTAPTSDPGGQQERKEVSGDMESEWRVDGQTEEWEGAWGDMRGEGEGGRP